ncbi:MAG: TraB/GumN family protein [Candidatus Woesearchaeota archaeon]
MKPYIIGTSHISKDSIEEIKTAIESKKPDIIAVELDRERATALFSEEAKTKMSFSEIFKIGLKGYLFAKVGQVVQRKLGQYVGSAPGSEMKTAIEEAKKRNLKVALIDQPIRITLKNFSKELTWKEKFHFIGDIFKGILFRKKQMKELGIENLDLNKVPGKELIKKMMGKLKKDYPNIYKTLVEDRNKYMVKKLVKLMRDNPEQKIVVVVGAGHQEGMEELLLKVDVI